MAVFHLLLSERVKVKLNNSWTNKGIKYLEIENDGDGGTKKKKEKEIDRILLINIDIK